MSVRISNNPVVLLLSRWATVIILCLYTLPVIALLIYIEPEANLDKCDVDFNGWMFAFIIMTFTFITITLVERYIEDTRFVAKAGIISFLILWIIACMLFSKSNKTGICKSVSFHTYNFIFYIISIPVGLLISLVIGIVITSL
uniref:Transmembrane protein n=1 Tax=Pithovirus LCPAC403 TaxID=2506596 RepID=A0A481ZDX7_9VIRU|nr:MAG: hypothetical protein LCPAC403_03730 [Pithovirus LCPAC403]